MRLSVEFLNQQHSSGDRYEERGEGIKSHLFLDDINYEIYFSSHLHEHRK